MDFKYINNTAFDTSIFISKRDYSNNYLLQLIPKIMQKLRKLTEINVTDTVVDNNGELRKVFGEIIAYIKSSWEPELKYIGTCEPEESTNFEDYSLPNYSYCVSYIWKKDKFYISIDRRSHKLDQKNFLSHYDSITGINFYLTKEYFPYYMDELGYLSIPWVLDNKGILYIDIHTKVIPEYIAAKYKNYISNSNSDDSNFWMVILILIISIIAIILITIISSLVFVAIRKTF